MASVRKRTWQSGGQQKTAWVADYVDQHGKRHLKTFERKKDADTWLVDARGEVKRGVHTPDSSTITVSDAAELWLLRGRQLKLERVTLANYQQGVKKHIRPLIGNLKLSRLSRPAVEVFRDALLDRVSVSSARIILRQFRSIIGEAQRRGLVAQNVATLVRLDARSRSTRVTEGEKMPSKEDLRALIEHAGPWKPHLLTLAFTGMRSSELRGLTWDNVDFKHNKIRVQQRADRWGTLGPPKTKAGTRDIPLTPMVAKALREWKLACPRKDGRVWLVFPNKIGGVFDYPELMRQAFYPAQIAAGLVDEKGEPKFVPHSLRHFFASWMIQLGFTPKHIQNVLGHGSIQMTFDVYGHLFPSFENDLAKFAEGELEVWGSHAEGP